MVLTQSQLYTSGAIGQQLRPYHFELGMCKMLLSVEILQLDLTVQCIMGIEHTFVDVLAYSSPSLGPCMISLLK